MSWFDAWFATEAHMYTNWFCFCRVIATSQMQKYGARQTFPCFDEPAFKAVFNIKLLCRSDLNYSAISNMPVVEWQVLN